MYIYLFNHLCDVIKAFIIWETNIELYKVKFSNFLEIFTLAHILITLYDINLLHYFDTKVIIFWLVYLKQKVFCSLIYHLMARYGWFCWCLLCFSPACILYYVATVNDEVPAMYILLYHGGQKQATEYQGPLGHKRGHLVDECNLFTVNSSTNKP